MLSRGDSMSKGVSCGRNGTLKKHIGNTVQSVEGEGAATKMIKA